MKRLLLIIPIILLIGITSCSPKLTPSPRRVIEMYFDYSKYSDQGFLISPDPYTQEYTSCGEILITIYPEEKLVKGGTAKLSSLEYKANEPDRLEKEEISEEELLKLAIESAIKKGANSLVNFKCGSIYNTYYSKTLKKEIKYFSHYEVSGFAIKRK